MHKIYEINDTMGIFRKRYCCHCGKRLMKINKEKLVKKGTKEHKEYCHIGGNFRYHGDILVISDQYFCKECGEFFSIEQQRCIAKAQKVYKRKILSVEEIKKYNKSL